MIDVKLQEIAKIEAAIMVAKSELSPTELRILEKAEEESNFHNLIPEKQHRYLEKHDHTHIESPAFIHSLHEAAHNHTFSGVHSTGLKAKHHHNASAKFREAAGIAATGDGHNARQHAYTAIGHALEAEGKLDGKNDAKATMHEDSAISHSLKADHYGKEAKRHAMNHQIVSRRK